MLESRRLIYRTPEPQDIDLFYNWENNTRFWKVSNTIVPFNKYLLKKFISSSHNLLENKQLRLVICLKDNHQPIGCVDLFDFDAINSKTGVGILIDEEYQNQGYAKEAIDIIMQYCNKTLNLHQIYCTIISNNVSSIKLFENCGFKHSGTKKDWVKEGNQYFDELLYQFIF
jgi:diamine N-acetyltransferase